MGNETLGLPVWVTNPEVVSNWVLAHQFEIALFGGIGILFFLIVCIAIGRLVNVDPNKKKKEFGKSVWADENALRKKGFLSKDL